MTYQMAQAPSLNKFSLSDLPIMTIGPTEKWEGFYDLLDQEHWPQGSSS
jgi:HAE1 family hydrophobic/amphiphilic exporter-1